MKRTRNHQQPKRQNWGLESLESRLVPGDTVLAGLLVRPLLSPGESFLDSGTSAFVRVSTPGRGAELANREGPVLATTAQPDPEREQADAGSRPTPDVRPLDSEKWALPPDDDLWNAVANFLAPARENPTGRPGLAGPESERQGDGGSVAAPDTAGSADAAPVSAVPPEEPSALALAQAAGIESGDGTGVAAAGCAGFTFDDFSSVDELQLNGSAAQANNRLRLTQAVRDQAGSAWFVAPQFVEGGFETSFQFQFSLRSSPNADGITFAIQNSEAGPFALGGIGGGLGYGEDTETSAIANSLVVEFDTFRNTAFGDATPNHISVHSGGPFANSAHEDYSLGSTGAIPALDDTQVHTAYLRYTPGTLEVFLDDLETPQLTVWVDLAATLSLNDGYAWVGFTSSTGSSWERHDILNWAFSACPVCSSLYYPDFGTTDGLQLNGDALATAGRLRLTPAQRGQAGSAWSAGRHYVEAGFDAVFEFQITGRSQPASADGLTFTVQNSSDGAFALGDGGGHLGYGGAGTPLANSLVVEFDTYFDRFLGDPNGNHISVHTRGTLPNSADESASLGSTTDIPSMKDGQVQTAWVHYVPGLLQVFLDDFETPRLSIPVNLAETLSLTQGYAWVGFTSSTGSYWERHDVLSWWFTSCV